MKYEAQLTAAQAGQDGMTLTMHFDVEEGAFP